MDTKEVYRRILAQSDDDPDVHGIYLTGSDEGIDYYLVIAQKVHEGREMLKIRYFAMNKTDPGDDTWMQNGITARSSDALTNALSEDLADIGSYGSAGDISFRDLSGVIP